MGKVIEVLEDGTVVSDEEPTVNLRYNRRRRPEQSPGERRREFEGSVKKVGKGVFNYLFSDKDDTEDALKDALKELDE
jgi:hypothetical protein